MNLREPELDPFTEALRLDLPSARDGERVRSRLVSAGVLAGAGVIAPSVAATTTGGLLAKLGALPIAAKIGASVMAVSVAGLPVWSRAARDGGGEAPKPGESRTLGVAPTEPAGPAPERPLRGPALVEPAESPKAVSTPARATPSPPSASRNTPLDETWRSLPAPMPSVGSFPVAPTEAIDEGTLRAETAVMERALSALRRGDHVTARRELAAHAERFPNGHLRPDRERAFERMLGKETQP
jgi:hypothetical protein